MTTLIENRTKTYIAPCFRLDHLTQITLEACDIIGFFVGDDATQEDDKGVIYRDIVFVYVAEYKDIAIIKRAPLYRKHYKTINGYMVLLSLPKELLGKDVIYKFIDGKYSELYSDDLMEKMRLEMKTFMVLSKSNAYQSYLVKNLIVDERTRRIETIKLKESMKQLDSIPDLNEELACETNLMFISNM